MMRDEEKPKSQPPKELTLKRQDVSESKLLEIQRQEIEEAFRDCQKMLQGLLTATVGAAFIIDTKGTILALNEITAKSLGKSSEELVGFCIFDFFPFEVAKARKESVFEVIRSAKPIYSEVEHQGMWLKQSIYPIFDEHGKVSKLAIYVRNLTERKQREEDLRKSEEDSKRLAQENAIVAEIGQIINSTLDIEEVYERFAQVVGQLIPFERIAITLINPRDYTFTVAYVVGPSVVKREVGKVVPLAGSGVEWIMKSRSSLIILEDNREEVINRLPGLFPTFKAGFRSMMLVPLIAKNQVIGVLNLQAFKPNAYKEIDLRLAQRIGDQIAGAIDNAQLFLQRKQSEEILRETEERYRLLFETSTDAVLIRDREGIIRMANPTAIKILKASQPHEVIGKAYLDFVHPEDRPGSINRIQRQIKAAQGEPGIDPADMVAPPREHRLLTLDGETIYVESTGIAFRHQGQAWIQGIFHNIIERKRAAEELRRSKEAFQHLAKENEIIAEIGRIISSTLTIEEVYDPFAAEVCKLIPFDRIAISAINPEDYTFTNLYFSGPYIPGRGVGEIIPLAGTSAEWVMKNQLGLFIQEENWQKIISRFPGLWPNLQAGFRSMIVIPLISKDQVIGVLYLEAFKPNAYSEKEFKLAERVGHQIAGAIVNAQLYMERKRSAEALRKSEEAARRLAQENAIVAEVGRIIGSTLEIDKVYELFAEEVRKVISFERIVITVIDHEKGTFHVAYNLGLEGDIPGRRIGEVVPLEGSFTEEIMRRRSSQLIQMEDGDEVAVRFPKLTPFLQRGYRSFMAVPLISHDQVIGVLHIYSIKSEAYREVDMHLAENIGSQIAGAIANSQLYSERKRVEEALRRSEEEAQRLAKENKTIADIGRIISSTLNIEDVYEHFAEEVRKLIPFDRIAIATVDPKNETFTISYAAGLEMANRRAGVLLPLRGTSSEEVMRTRSSLLIQMQNQEDVAKFSGLEPYYEAGFRSLMVIPLIAQDQLIGVLHIRSTKINAYTEKDLRLAERVGHQIAGAIANAQLYSERKRAEEALRRSEEEAKQLAQENAIMAEIGRIVSSTLDTEEVYERFAEEVRKLIYFDRIAVHLIIPEEDKIFEAYVFGLVEIEGRRMGDVFPLKGSIAEELKLTRSGMRFCLESKEQFAQRFPRLLPTFYQAGLRSIISVPLIHGDEVIGVLHLWSKETNAYNDRDLRLTERIATQIAGAIVNAQLYLERKRSAEALRKSEEAARRLAQENAIVAEVGRIIDSTLEIDKVYELFAEKVRKVISFDRIAITIINHEKGTFYNAYNLGVESDIPGRRIGEIVPLEGSFTEEIMRRRSSQLIQTEDGDEVAVRVPKLMPYLQRGYRSFMAVPLISHDQVIGVLHIYSKKSEAYREVDMHLAESIGSQIAGAIANAQLYLERKNAEEELQRSREAAQRLAKENEIIADIGRIISSTLNPEEIYELLSREANKIIPFDRLAINLINPDHKSITVNYTSGDNLEKRGKGDVFPLHGSIIEEMMSTKKGLLFNPQNKEEVGNRLPILIHTFQAGFWSMISAPIISKDMVIGALHFRSKKPNFYTESDLRVAERMASQIAGAISNTQLYSELKTAEEALKASEEKYRFLIEHATESIWISQDDVLKFVNPKCSEITGYSQAELMSRPWIEFFHPEEQNLVKDRNDRRLKGEKPPSFYESKIIHKDGSTRWVQLNVVVVQWYGRPAVMSFMTDITERKMLESQLLESQKMEAIGTLAGGIAHDFNNILAAIIGYAELTGFDILEGSRAANNLKELLKASQRAKDLVNQILAFSRRSEQDRKPIELKVIIKEGLKLLRATLPATIEIQQHMETSHGLIEGNPTQIHQVLMNLCTNAAHAMEEDGGLLEVSLVDVHIDARMAFQHLDMQPGPHVRLTVSDTGKGIAPEVLGRIFDPYFTTKEVGKGTGLGLAVVHGIVKSHGGAITVSSKPGRGTTFHVFLPRIEHAQEAKEGGKVEPLPLGRHERILLVDDEQAIAKIGQKIMEHLGYEVTARTSSIEALELLRANPDRFDLVITDMTMPNMTGDKLAQEMLRIRPNLPIILSTGFSERISEQKAKGLGIREFVMKPLNMNDLAMAIRRALERMEYS